MPKHVALTLHNNVTRKWNCDWRPSLCTVW